MADRIADIAELVMQDSGQDILRFEPGFIRSTVSRRQLANGFKDIEHYSAFLSVDSGERAALLSGLLDTYTTFFRNPLTFSYLDQILLPQLISRNAQPKGRTIRIWSAGCSTGQEAYSLAMLLLETIARTGSDCSFRIFATDISLPSLKTARQGKYEPEAVKDLSLRLLEKYFIQHGNHFIISDELKQYIDFTEYNLLNPNSVCPPACIYGDLDMALCSNVLFYYREDIQRSVLSKLHRCLSPDGFLVTDSTERDFVLQTKLFKQFAPFVPIYTPNAQR